MSQEGPDHCGQHNLEYLFNHFGWSNSCWATKSWSIMVLESVWTKTSKFAVASYSTVFALEHGQECHTKSAEVLHIFNDAFRLNTAHIFPCQSAAQWWQYLHPHWKIFDISTDLNVTFWQITRRTPRAGAASTFDWWKSAGKPWPTYDDSGSRFSFKWLLVSLARSHSNENHEPLYPINGILQKNLPLGHAKFVLTKGTHVWCTDMDSLFPCCSF